MNLVFGILRYQASAKYLVAIEHSKSRYQFFEVAAFADFSCPINYLSLIIKYNDLYCPTISC